MAKAFIALGLEPRKSVGIIGFNSPEWFMADLAAIFANSMATGIYSTNSPEMCKYMANHSNANIIVVEDDSQLQKILKVKSELPGKILFKLVQTCHRTILLKRNSDTGNRTRACWVRASYPNP